MIKRIGLFAVLSLLAASCFAQAPCPSGTLANVLGTSCTIGNVTFTFDTNFQGFHQTNDTGTNLVTTFFTADTIGFVPVQSGNQVGFKLNPNFVADASSMFLNFFDASFSYELKVNGNFEITGETASMVASITQLSNENVNTLDAHCFTNGFCLEVFPTLNFIPGIGSTNNLTSTGVLPIPGLESNNPHPFGLNFTTNLTSFAFNPGDAVLSSASFLYTVVPQTPAPPPANLRYKNIDLPGEAGTFAAAINDRGQIAGTLVDLDGATHGYITDRDGENLTLIDFPGAAATFVNGINNRGDMVGQYNDNAGVTHGFVLTDGSFSTLDFPNSLFNGAEGINDRGQVAGFYENPDFGVHGYLFDQGVFKTVDDPNAFVFNGPNNVPFTITEIFALNNGSDLVGFSLDINNFGHSFLRSDNTFHRIDVPAGVEGTFIIGVNDSDDTVGDFTDINVVTHGFLNERKGFSTVDFPSATGTFPSQINSEQRIVGTYSNDNNATFHSFLAVPGNQTGDDQGNEASVAPKTGSQNQATSPQSSADKGPCLVRRPMHPDPSSGVMICGSTH